MGIVLPCNYVKAVLGSCIPIRVIAATSYSHDSSAKDCQRHGRQSFITIVARLPYACVHSLYIDTGRVKGYSPIQPAPGGIFPVEMHPAFSARTVLGV